MNAGVNVNTTEFVSGILILPGMTTLLLGSRHTMFTLLLPRLCVSVAEFENNNA